MQLSSILLAGTAMAGVVFAQGSKPNVNTPNPLIQCQNYQITFSGGTPPYSLYATKEGVYGDILSQIGSNISGTSYTWKVNLAAGTQINLFITDASGQQNTSGGATILGSNDSSCLGTANTSSAPSGGASGSSTSAGSSPSSSSGGNSGSSGSTSAPSSSNTGSSGASRSTSGSGASQTSEKANGASQLTGFSAAVAGAVGVAVAALV
ncbi:uncharacterized protein FA14DRAFT_161049 [Meira miltonrushii]|uniref:Uncharacterized protein n=1 Tax=Meira miltonrushii TaxID=1280837 RepID=A0A316VJN9_9BASI|nr:uncharacterized protein FA14DRAFT_161049 [Meira miltonrushii]PWN36241.1 hypothetical protein FA14DRAFT_161049 [Meira miltonrushii]